MKAINSREYAPLKRHKKARRIGVEDMETPVGILKKPSEDVA